MSSLVSVINFEIPLETVIGAVFIQSLEKGVSFVPFSIIISSEKTPSFSYGDESARQA